MELKKDMEANQLVRISQKVLFYDKDDGKFLFLKVAKPGKDAPHHLQWYKDYGPWDIPGGHIKQEEVKLNQAVAREIQEEIGFEIEGADEVCCFELMTNKKTQHRGFNVIYLMEYAGGPIILSDEHEDFVWFTVEEIADNKEIKSWLKEAVEKAVVQLEQKDSLNSWHRCLADFDNYKKRSVEQQKDFSQYAGQTVINEMLPVLDNFHASTDHIPEDQKNDPWVTGIMYIQQQMEKVFDDQGVTEITVAIGDEFDAETMEAMEANQSKVESPKSKDEKGREDDATEASSSPEKDDQEHKVTKIVQKGYMIKDKILRPARVIVGVIKN